MEFLIILIGISIPIGVYLWRESRHNNPGARWPQLAEMVEFECSQNPPRLTGQWKGRKLTLTSIGLEAVLTTPLRCQSQIRFEIGPKDEVEKSSGMVVPDRVDFGDHAFESRWLVRSTPLEMGQMAVDPSMRARLLTLPDIRVLAGASKLDIRVPNPTESSDLRAYFDVAASLADAIDGN